MTRPGLTSPVLDLIVTPLFFKTRDARGIHMWFPGHDSSDLPCSAGLRLYFLLHEFKRRLLPVD